MVGRFNEMDLNGGFAAPNPDYENWQPDEDKVPVAGKRKDPRFLEQNLWSTKPMRPKPKNISAYATVQEDDAVTKSPPKLDGTGAWEDWGVKVPEKKMLSADLPVPLDIDGMNQVLAHRAKEASAKSAAAYAKPFAPIIATKAQNPPSENENEYATDTEVKIPAHIPPHKRKVVATQPSAPTLSTPVMARPVHDKEDIKSLLLDRLTRLTERRAWDNKEDTENLLINDRAAQKTVLLPQLATNPIRTRPEPGNHFTVSMDASRPSSATLFSDDETIAMRLQADEYGLENINDAHTLARDHYNQWKSSSDPNVQGASVYRKLHKIQEILWKQDTMKLPAFSATTGSLSNMQQAEFDNYYSRVVSMFLAQWNSRYDRIYQMMTMQADMKTGYRYTVDEMLAMDGIEFKTVLDKTTLAYKYKASTLSSSSSSDGRFMLTENDLGEEQEFDSEEVCISGDEEDADNEVDGRMAFTGRL